MQHQKTALAGIFFLITGLAGCDSNEIGDIKDVNQDKVYMDYVISYTEGEENFVKRNVLLKLILEKLIFLNDKFVIPKNLQKYYPKKTIKQIEPN